jgi:hypothetical protein
LFVDGYPYNIITSIRSDNAAKAHVRPVFYVNFVPNALSACKIASVNQQKGTGQQGFKTNWHSLKIGKYV